MLEATNLFMMFSDAGSSLEASSKTPMACDSGIGFNIPGSISIPPRPSSAMSREGIGFPPLRIDRGEGESILAGTQGEILRVDEFGGAIGGRRFENSSGGDEASGTTGSQTLRNSCSVSSFH